MKEKTLFTVQRIVSWILVPLIIVEVITGYAYTRQIRFLHRGLAFDVHTTLDLPLLLLLVVHVIIGARSELRRFKIKGKTTDYILVIIGVAAGLALLYIELKIV
ncbi:MAG: hypothetical protein PVF58_21580 [Candidatus Methanofastidiosia archaeon]|jgi:hypothetical protein